MGTRYQTLFYMLLLRDHPHACGDKGIQFAKGDKVMGSSPRVWGQEEVQVMAERLQRIIPTRVGTSVLQYLLHLLDEDHPHACGDKRASIIQPPVRQGSSPRVWGQENKRIPFTSTGRIIPTRVGTSHVRLSTLGLARDHPHACGDKTKEIKENSGFAKSTA